MEQTTVEMTDELKNKCIKILKFIKDNYNYKNVTKSTIFKEFNITENKKDKIFNFLESNGVKFVKTIRTLKNI